MFSELNKGFVEYGIDIHGDGKSDKDYFNVKDRIIKDLDYLQKQIEIGLIEEDEFLEKRQKLKEFLTNFEGGKQELIQAYNQEKSEIYREIGLELNGEKVVSQLQLGLYENLGIDRYTYKNGMIDQFIKGIIDTVVIGNAQLVELVYEHGIGVILDALGEIFSWEGIKQLIEETGESLYNLFWDGNAYEKGKALGDLGLKGSGIFIAFKGLQFAAGVAKKSIKKSQDFIGDIAEEHTFGLQYSTQQGYIDESLLGNYEGMSRVSENGQEIITPQERSLDQLVPQSYNASSRHEFVSDIHVNGLGILDTSDLNIEQKRFVNSLLTENFPLIEILRLVPGENIMNISLSGIKNLNDIFGQEFVNEMVFEFKQMVKDDFDRLDTPHRKRIVKDSYKNFTIVGEAGDFLKVFENYGNRREMFEKLLQRSEPAIQRLSNERGFSKEKIGDTILTHFNFGVGMSKVGRNPSDIDKLDTIHQVEIASKKLQTLDEPIELFEYDNTAVMGAVQEVLELKSSFIDTWAGKEFHYGGLEYSAVVTGVDGKQYINDLLLRYVRKYGDEGKVRPEGLSNEVQILLKKLNDSMDFMSPTVNINNDIKLAKFIDNRIREGRIPEYYLTHNYKGLTKEGLFAISNGRKGMKVFIDIKDMGIDNISDFLKRAEEISSIQRQVEQGLLTREKGLMEIQSLKLNAGMEVTEKLNRAVSIIKQKYPGVQLSVGGDEIFAHIDGEILNTQEILSDLSSIFGRVGLKSRMTMTQELGNGKEIFSSLDYLTRVNKIFEDTIEGVIYKRGLVGYERVPSSTSVHISHRAEKFLLSGENDLKNILHKSVDEKKLLDIIQSSSGHGKSSHVGSYNGLDIYVTKYESGLYEFNIQ